MALQAAPPQAFCVLETLQTLVQLGLVAELDQHIRIVLAPFGFQFMLQGLRQGDRLLVAIEAREGIQHPRKGAEGAIVGAAELLLLPPNPPPAISRTFMLECTWSGRSFLRTALETGSAQN
ncbi:MAG: hypothetical protein WCH37_12350, partial [Synechococcaceae cyanobacterium ELA182]